MRKVVKKVGGIVLSGALALSGIVKVPMQEVRAEGGTAKESSVSAMGVSEAVGEFLNANALNVWDKNGSKYTQAKQDKIEALYVDKKSVEKEDREKVTKTIPKVYFGGNEYYIVNAHDGGKVTLVASKSYGKQRFNGSSDEAGVEYANSEIQKYLTMKSESGLYKSFFADKRELEWEIVEGSTIYTGKPDESNSNIVDSGNDIINNAVNIDILDDQKFYLMGGMYKGGRNTEDAEKDYDAKACEPYAYAGALEKAEAGYAVHCGLFENETYPLLRSAYFSSRNSWYVCYVGSDNGFVTGYCADNAVEVAPACNLALSHIIFASESESEASEKIFFQKSAALEGDDKKIKLTLLDDGTKGSNLPEIAGQTAVSENVVTFKKTSGELGGANLKLMCKYNGDEFAMISLDNSNNDAYTFYLTNNGKSDGEKLTNVSDVKVLVCKDNEKQSGDVSTDSGYVIRYAREVLIGLSGTVSISDGGVLSKNNDYALTATYKKGSTDGEVMAEGEDYEFQWCDENGDVISGATSATYCPKESDYGKILMAEVVGKGKYGGKQSATVTVKLNFADALILNPFIYVDKSNKDELADSVRISFNGNVLSKNYVRVSAIDPEKSFQTLNVNADISADSIWAGSGRKEITCYYQAPAKTLTDISSEVVAVDINCTLCKGHFELV